MLGGLASKHGNQSLKSRRAMMETLFRHLGMVRLSAGALAAIALAGCSGLIDGDEGATLTPEEMAARTAYIEKAKPHLDLVCASCHSGSDPNVNFMPGADAMAQRTALLAFDPQVINLEAPGSSRLLTKGAHSGPALTAQQSSDILQWIQAERDAANVTGDGDTSLKTARLTPVLCTDPNANPGDPTCPINTVDLAPLLEGWAGAQITFVAIPLSQDLYVTNLSLKPGAQGAYIEHPLFVSWTPEGQATPDTLDRFFNVKMNMAADAPAEMIAGGTAAFINFAPNNQISIHFKIVEAYRPDEGGGGGGGGGATGCKQVQSFVTNAQPQLQQRCASCHASAANANARGALDITGIGDTANMTTMQNVCNQVRTRINFQDTNNSGFYLAPDPRVTSGHDFKFPADLVQYNAFRTPVDIWVQAERTSP